MGRKKKANRKSSVTRVLAQTYYDPRCPGAYGDAQALRRATKFKRPQVQEWLSHQDDYTLHKPVRRNFVRRRIIVGGIDHQFQADLIDVRNLKKRQWRLCVFVDLHRCVEQVCLGGAT